LKEKNRPEQEINVVRTSSTEIYSKIRKESKVLRPPKKESAKDPILQTGNNHASNGKPAVPAVHPVPPNRVFQGSNYPTGEKPPAT
jgi:hypothetical protein